MRAVWRSARPPLITPKPSLEQQNRRPNLIYGCGLRRKNLPISLVFHPDFFPASLESVTLALTSFGDLGQPGSNCKIAEDMNLEINIFECFGLNFVAGAIRKIFSAIFNGSVGFDECERWRDDFYRGVGDLLYSSPEPNRPRALKSAFNPKRCMFSRQTLG